MPYSSGEGKAWVAEVATRLRPATVLDVGAGAGAYASLLRPLLPDARLVALEVWEPYVYRFGLHRLYDEVLVGDARTLPLPSVDLVVLGDVVEHMAEDEAVALWARCRAAGRHVVLSLPVVHYPQGPCEGNPHEEHVVDDWSHERVLATFPGIVESRTYTEIGVYLAAATIPDADGRVALSGGDGAPADLAVPGAL